MFCVQVITLDMDFGYNFGGVLTDFDGAMVALWASYAKPVAGEVRDMVRGLPAGPIENARDEVLSWRLSGKRGVGSVRLLDAEFGVLQLAKANDHGVPNEWVERLMRADPVRRQALTVASTVADSGAAKTLNGGDVVLTAGGDPVVSFRGMERAVAGADSVGADSSLQLKLLREGKVVDVTCPLSDESCAGTGRLLHWAGCQLQPTHRPVVELGYRPTDPASGAHLDVFISRWYHGSPAQRYGVYALNWVASVNGTPYSRPRHVHQSDQVFGGWEFRAVEADQFERAAEGADGQAGPALLAHLGAAKDDGRDERVGEGVAVSVSGAEN